MNIDRIVPIQGYVVISQKVEERTTASGLTLQDNEDDFVAHGCVEKSFAGGPEVGSSIVFSVLDTMSFFDSEHPQMHYACVKDSAILGSYVAD